MAAAFAGVALAFAVTAWLDLRSGVVLVPWQVERQLGIRVLGRAGGGS